MSRTLSTPATQALFAQETGEVFLCLLTISHPALAGPICVVNNTQDIVSRGVTYIAFPFDIILPDEREDQLPQVQLSIQNVDRRIALAVRSLPPGTQASVSLEVVLASSPDTVEIQGLGFSLLQVDYDAMTVTGTLSYEWILSEPFPAGVMGPTLFPGMFT